MLKLYIYGYLNRVQSSRRLEREAGRNLEVMWAERGGRANSSEGNAGDPDDRGGTRRMDAGAVG
jgi:hypothetical protein